MWCVNKSEYRKLQSPKEIEQGTPRTEPEDLPFGQCRANLPPWPGTRRDDWCSHHPDFFGHSLVEPLDDMKLPEDIRERWNLPKQIMDLYQAAYEAEVAWHIFDVFGYDTSVLSNDNLDWLYAMFCHEDANTTHGLKRVSACTAFTKFVTANGGAIKFGLKPAQFADW